MLKQMRCSSLALMIAGALTICPPDAMATQTEFTQKVNADSISAAVSIFPVLVSDYEIFVTFRSFQPSTHPAGCVSVYRDFRYTLRAADGRVIAADQQTLAHPPPERTIISLRTSDLNRPWNCARDGLQYSNGRAFLSKIYPRLAPGVYTLEMEFAPRWLGTRVPLPAARINIPTGVSP